MTFAVIPIASGHRGGSHGSGFRDRASGRAAHAGAGLLLGLDDRQEGAQEQFAGRLNDAARFLWRVLDEDPANGRAHRDVAYVYAASVWYVLAESEIEQALAALPKDSETHYIAGTVYYERGRPGDARSHFERAAALDPTNAKAARRAQRAK